MPRGRKKAVQVAMVAEEDPDFVLLQKEIDAIRAEEEKPKSPPKEKKKKVKIEKVAKVPESHSERYSEMQYVLVPGGCVRKLQIGDVMEEEVVADDVLCEI